MCPDENNNVRRIYRVHKKEVQCTSDLLRICNVKNPELCSMVACLASDTGLDMVDFDMSDMKVWRAAKNRLKRELGLTPHFAVVAKAIARSRMIPVGVAQHTGTPW